MSTMTADPSRASELRNTIYTAIHQMDQELSETDPSFMHAALVVAALTEGADEETLARLLGYDTEFVNLAGNRLRSSGIWVGKMTAAEHVAAWQEDGGAMAFWMDISVADGTMIIAQHDNEGKPLYSVTASGNRRIKQMIARSKKQGDE
jgi:hypothetical protein